MNGNPPGTFIAGDLMKRYHLKKGDFLTVLDAGVEKKTRILGPLPEGIEGGLNENLAVMDISSAQDIFGRVGRLDRIDLMIDEPGASALPILAPGLKVTDANSRKSTLTAMLYSFQLNLAAMSLIALFVGVFLIYNFSMFSVLSRRQDMSLLLTLGCNRGIWCSRIFNRVSCLGRFWKPNRYHIRIFSGLLQYRESVLYNQPALFSSECLTR